MSQKDFMKFFDPAFAKNFTGFGAYPFDFKAVVENQRKNFEVFTEAQKMAVENMQAIMQSQNELLSQLVEDNAAMASEIMSEGTPEEKVAKQADLVRKNYEKSMKNFKQISDMVSKSNQKTSELMNKRITASLAEVKAVIEEGSKITTKKAA